MSSQHIYDVPGPRAPCLVPCAPVRLRNSKRAGKEAVKEHSNPEE